MKEFERKSFLVNLIKRMQEAGSWTGETHIQKTVYFLQNLLNIPLDFDYIFYKHGPFSFELRDEIGELKAEDFLRMQPKDPYGASYLPGKEVFVDTLEEKYGEEADKFTNQIDFIAKEISPKTVQELEKLSTALYVQKEKEITDSQDMVKKIVELKPHIKPEAAQEAVERLKECQDKIE